MLGVAVVSSKGLRRLRPEDGLQLFREALDAFPDLVAGLVQAVLGGVVVDPDVPGERTQRERLLRFDLWSWKPTGEHLSASLHSDGLCEGDVCAGSKRNEEPWQPRNCRAGRITAGIPGASSSGDGKGIGTLHTD